jgi:small subunit ribosomal protein S18
MAKKSKPRKNTKRVIKTGPCFFCESKTEPDYLNADELHQFVTDRAKIVSNDFSGLCSKHQRRLSVAAKRARHLALLPFTVKI